MITRTPPRASQDDPLRVVDEAERGDPTAQRLADALDQVYPGASDPRGAAASWAMLEDVAARAAARLRRWRAPLRWLEGIAPWRPVSLALGVGVVIVAAFGLSRSWSGRAPWSPPPSLTSAAPGARIMSLASGATIELHGAADVDEADAARARVTLRRGRLLARVPKLHAGAALTVVTAHADVIVHGTRFSVELAADATRVDVTEGLVEVRPRAAGLRSAFLRPGDSLSVPGPAGLAARAATVKKLVEAASCADVAVVRTHLTTAAAGEETTAALYLDAHCTAAQGRVSEAIGRFEQVTRTATDPARADSAAARAAQLRAGLDPADGVRAWRDYLRRFPSGLHRPLAHAFLQSKHSGVQPGSSRR